MYDCLTAIYIYIKQQRFLKQVSKVLVTFASVRGAGPDLETSQDSSFGAFKFGIGGASPTLIAR